MINRICSAGTVVGSLMLASCATTNINPDPTSEADYLAAISEAEYMLAEWGTATASPIAFQTLDKERPFKFDMDKDATFYFDSARTNKSSAFSILEQTSFVLGLAGKTSEDKFQQQRVGEELAIYRQNQHIQEDNRRAYQQELESYREQEKQIDSLASENYQFCQVTVVEMQNTASSLEDAKAREEAFKAVIAQRNACLDTYLAKVQPTKPQPPSTDNTFPSLGDHNVPANNPALPGQLSNRSALLDPKDLRASSGLSNAELKIPDHEALRQAASNFWLQQMFEVLGNPRDPNNLFGVSMVSVNPGWRSREDYKAQIDIQGKIRYREASQKFICQFIKNDKNSLIERIAIMKAHDPDDQLCSSGLNVSTSTLSLDSTLPELSSVKPKDQQIYEQPQIIEGPPLEFTPISPTSMGQNIDLDSVTRRDLLLSLSLSQALRSIGAETQAEVFAEFARRQQRSAVSVTALNSVNVYSYGNSVVGVEVGPQFQAADTQGSGDTQGEFLQKQTFPILLVAKLRDPKIYGYRIFKDCNGLPYCLYQPSADITTSHRWLPIDKPWLAFLGTRPTLLETREVRAISKSLESCQKMVKSSFIKMRCNEVLSKLAGTFVFENLELRTEKPKVPAITGVFPTKLSILADDNSGNFQTVSHDFVITGSHLNLIDKNRAGNLKLQTVFASGQTVTSSRLVGANIHASVSITRDIKEPIMFRFEHDGKPMTTAAATSGTALVVVNKPKSPGDENIATIQLNGKTTKIPKTLGNAPNNIANVLHALNSADCHRMEKKTFKIGDKTLEIPEGYCDVPTNAKILLEKMIKP